MGLIYPVFLDNDDGDTMIYSCLKCKRHLCTHDQLISKDFHGTLGKAYLFSKVSNIRISPTTEDKIMTTGKHRISYIQCVQCEERLGWTYIKAFEADQKYKEGKFILEKMCLQLPPSRRATSITTFL